MEDKSYLERFYTPLKMLLIFTSAIIFIFGSILFAFPLLIILAFCICGCGFKLLLDVASRNPRKKDVFRFLSCLIAAFCAVTVIGYFAKDLPIPIKIFDY